MNFRDFLGGPVVKNPPSKAGDPGSVTGWGTKIPCANGHLSPHATATEPALALELTKNQHMGGLMYTYG